MGKEHVDPFVALKQRDHALLALGAQKVAGNGLEDLEARVARDHLAEAAAALLHGRGGERAGQFDDLQVLKPFAVGLFHQERAGLAALGEEVRAHVAHVERRVFRDDEAVGQKHGDARVPRLGKHRVPALFDDGGEGDDVHLIGDEGADGLDLVLLLLLGVVVHQLHAGALGGLLDVARVAHAPGALAAELGKAQQHRILAAIARRILRGAPRRAAAQRQKQRQRQKSGQKQRGSGTWAHGHPSASVFSVTLF